MATDGDDLPAHDLDKSRLEDLRVVLTPTRLRLVQQILASSTGALSATELAARNTITESTIRDHLQDLRTRSPPIVTTLTPDESPVPHGIPRIYFAVTKHGIDLLQQLNFYEQVGVLHDMYEAAELSLPDPNAHPVTLEEIEEYDHRPQPDWL